MTTQSVLLIFSLLAAAMLIGFVMGRSSMLAHCRQLLARQEERHRREKAKLVIRVSYAATRNCRSIYRGRN